MIQHDHTSSKTGDLIATCSLYVQKNPESGEGFSVGGAAWGDPWDRRLYPKCAGEGQRLYAASDRTS